MFYYSWCDILPRYTIVYGILLLARAKNPLTLYIKCCKPNICNLKVLGCFSVAVYGSVNQQVGFRKKLKVAIFIDFLSFFPVFMVTGRLQGDV